MPDLREFVEGRLAGYDAFLQNNPLGTKLSGMDAIKLRGGRRAG